MKTNSYKVQSFGRFSASTASTFEQALEDAELIARASSLPATITDSHGCEWTVRSADDYDLRSCPAAPVTCGCGL